MLSREQKKKDRVEAIEARREAASIMKGVMEELQKARKKLEYNKSNIEVQEIKRIENNLNDLIEQLEDPEMVI